VRATLGILPIALVGLGCSNLRPWTPSVSVAFWAENVPAGQEFAVPSSSQLAARWKVAPSSPWAPYHKGTLISAVDPMAGLATLPDARRLEVVGRAQNAAANVARVGLPADALWLVDLRGAASAAFAARLSIDAREPVAPVVTFNNWPAEDGLVPADETLAGLLSFAPRLPPPDENAIRAAHPVFLLDAWRLAFRFDEPSEDVFDNRYMLTSSDLPDVDVLRQQGIRRVIYVVEDLDDAEVEEDDVHASFRAWQAAGIAIEIVDLDFLEGLILPPGADWAPLLGPRGYWVRDRYTLVDDPQFYFRARGGFGLAYGRPYIYHGYGGHWPGGGGWGRGFYRAGGGGGGGGHHGGFGG
jgi:hypothetical protein